MQIELADPVNLIWDLTNERVTLGGALVLRQEGELLAIKQGQSKLVIHLICNQSDLIYAKNVAQTIFDTSHFSFHVVHSEDAIEGWPPLILRSQSDFSYYSFSRLVALHAESGLKPRLQWKESQKILAQSARKNFQGRLFCVHLRSVSPFLPEDSNADGYVWDSFFKKNANPGICDFLLMGDDPLPVGLNLRPGVTRAINKGLSLATQLALVGICDGFLGMASGLCTAANFSETPHVIFKHPNHDTFDMARELKNCNSYAFAENHQQLWRVHVGYDVLNEAFHLITS